MYINFHLIISMYKSLQLLFNRLRWQQNLDIHDNMKMFKMWKLTSDEILHPWLFQWTAPVETNVEMILRDVERTQVLDLKVIKAKSFIPFWKVDNSVSSDE